MDKKHSVREAAKLLGYSTNSIYGFLKDGLIKSVRIGKGNFLISKTEINKFEGKDEPAKKVVKDEPESAPKNDLPVSVLLPVPRSGKSLSDLSGESLVHTVKLWFEERVGLPSLFDWLASMTSIVLGVSLFLYSSQADILSIGRLSLWLNPVRLTFIIGGIGLILGGMIQTEADGMSGVDTNDSSAVLTNILSQKEQIASNSSDISEIFTDRVVLGLEVVAPLVMTQDVLVNRDATISGTLFQVSRL